MQAILARADEMGSFRLLSVEALQHYCYVVAGIVGELLTELFLHDCPALEPVRSILLEHQVSFGEGLQLVNILKDEKKDATDGRTYLPSEVPRGEVLALARRDLAAARLYIAALERGGASAGYVGFTTLSVDLADATLVRLEEEGLVAPLLSKDRRRPYRITGAGSAVLTERLQSAMKVATIGLRRLGEIG